MNYHQNQRCFSLPQSLRGHLSLLCLYFPLCPFDFSFPLTSLSVSRCIHLKTQFSRKDIDIYRCICILFCDIEVKNKNASVGDIRDLGLIPGLGRSPGEGNGNPLQYSCLGNPMDRGAWQATVHEVAMSQIGLSTKNNFNVSLIQGHTKVESQVYWFPGNLQTGIFGYHFT